MKTVKIIALVVVLLAGGLFALRAYNTANAPLEANLLYAAKPSIEEYLQNQMHDHGSLELEVTSLPLRLDTIQDAALFPCKRGYYLLEANHRGKNPLGATVLATSVFYVTPEGTCIYHQPISKLAVDELGWIQAANSAAIQHQMKKN